MSKSRKSGDVGVAEIFDAVREHVTGASEYLYIKDGSHEMDITDFGAAIAEMTKIVADSATTDDFPNAEPVDLDKYGNNTYNDGFAGPDFAYALYQDKETKKYYGRIMVHLGGDPRNDGNYTRDYFFEMPGDDPDKAWEEFFNNVVLDLTGNTLASDISFDDGSVFSTVSDTFNPSYMEDYKVTNNAKDGTEGLAGKIAEAYEIDAAAASREFADIVAQYVGLKEAKGRRRTAAVIVAKMNALPKAAGQLRYQVLAAVTKAKEEGRLLDKIVAAEKSGTAAAEKPMLWLVKFKDGTETLLGMNENAKRDFETREKDRIVSIQPKSPADLQDGPADKKVEAAGIARVWQHIENALKEGEASFAIFTASQAQTVDTGEGRSKKTNRVDVNEVARTLKHLGTGAIRLEGVYQGSGEPSWFVPGISLPLVEVFAKHYAQWSFIYCGPETQHQITLFESADRGVSDPYAATQVFTSTLYGGFEDAENYSKTKGHKFTFTTFPDTDEGRVQALSEIQEWVKKNLEQKRAAASKVRKADDEGSAVDDFVAVFGERWRKTIESTLEEPGEGNNNYGAGAFVADGIRYNYFDSEDDAVAAAEDSVRNMLEDDPSMFNQDWLRQHIAMSDTDRRLTAGEMADSVVDSMSEAELMEKAGFSDWSDDIAWADSEDGAGNPGKVLNGYESVRVADAVRQGGEWLVSYYGIDGKGTPDAGTVTEEGLEDKLAEILADYIEAKTEDLADKARDTVQSDLYDDIYKRLEDPIQYFCHDEGMYSEDELLKQSFIRIDVDSATTEAVSTDGWAHFLSNYDGNYEETKGGRVYYREDTDSTDEGEDGDDEGEDEPEETPAPEGGEPKKGAAGAAAGEGPYSPATLQMNKMGHIHAWPGKVEVIGGWGGSKYVGKYKGVEIESPVYFQTQDDTAAIKDSLPAEEWEHLEAGFPLTTQYFAEEYFGERGMDLDQLVENAKAAAGAAGIVPVAKPKNAKEFFDAVKEEMGRFQKGGVPLYDVLVRLVIILRSVGGKAGLMGVGPKTDAVANAILAWDKQDFNAAQAHAAIRENIEAAIQEAGAGKGTEGKKKPGGIVVRPKGSQFEVFDENEGKVLGTHKTKKEATEQQQAVYASMNRASKKDAKSAAGEGPDAFVDELVEKVQETIDLMLNIPTEDMLAVCKRYPEEKDSFTNKERDSFYWYVQLPNHVDTYEAFKDACWAVIGDGSPFGEPNYSKYPDAMPIFDGMLDTIKKRQSLGEPVSDRAKALVDLVAIAMTEFAIKYYEIVDAEATARFTVNLVETFVKEFGFAEDTLDELQRIHNIYTGYKILDAGLRRRAAGPKLPDEKAAAIREEMSEAKRQWKDPEVRKQYGGDMLKYIKEKAVQLSTALGVALPAIMAFLSVQSASGYRPKGQGTGEGGALTLSPGDRYRGYFIYGDMGAGHEDAFIRVWNSKDEMDAWEDGADDNESGAVVETDPYNREEDELGFVGYVSNGTGYAGSEKAGTSDDYMEVLDMVIDALDARKLEGGGLSGTAAAKPTAGKTAKAESGERGASASKTVHAKVVEKGGKWYVESEKGKNLGGPYDSKEKAEKRLGQVEYFKHKKGAATGTYGVYKHGDMSGIVGEVQIASLDTVLDTLKKEKYLLDDKNSVGNDWSVREEKNGDITVRDEPPTQEVFIRLRPIAKVPGEKPAVAGKNTTDLLKEVYRLDDKIFATGNSEATKAWSEVLENAGVDTYEELSDDRLRGAIEHGNDVLRAMKESASEKPAAAGINRARFKWVPATEPVVNIGTKQEVLTDLETGEEFCVRSEIMEENKEVNVLFFDINGDPLPENDGEDADDMSDRLEEEFIEKVREYEETPQEGDYIIHDDGVSVYGDFEGRFVGGSRATDFEEAARIIREDVKQGNWYAFPTVWMLSDHGNYHRVTDFKYEEAPEPAAAGE